jgi:hypothetical protein
VEVNFSVEADLTALTSGLGATGYCRIDHGAAESADAGFVHHVPSGKRKVGVENPLIIREIIVGDFAPPHLSKKALAVYLLSPTSLDHVGLIDLTFPVG